MSHMKTFFDFIIDFPKIVKEWDNKIDRDETFWWGGGERGIFGNVPTTNNTWSSENWLSKKKRKKKITCFKHNFFFLSQIVSAVRGLLIAVPQDVETVATSDRQSEFVAGEREDLVCCVMREAAVKMLCKCHLPQPLPWWKNLVDQKQYFLVMVISQDGCMFKHCPCQKIS